MPPFNPFELLTEHITNLFSGLFVDATTVTVALIGLAFVVFGTGIIAEMLGGHMRNRDRSYHLERSQRYLDERSELKHGSAEWLERGHLANFHARKAAKTKMRDD